MLEIERKFLVQPGKWIPKGKGQLLKQGYLSTDKNRIVRVRISDELAYITIKGKNIGISRTEFEYEIPQTDALILLKMCLNKPIEKTRYTETVGNMLWEIDVFDGANKGLIIAEIELENEQQKFILPDWVGDEVSNDKKYYNSYLSANPYTEWHKPIN